VKKALLVKGAVSRYQNLNRSRKGIDIATKDLFIFFSKIEVFNWRKKLGVALITHG